MKITTKDGEIEVLCREDGVTLLYATAHRHDDELPKIKAK